MSIDHGSNNQSGDHQSRDHAGRDIVNVQLGDIQEVQLRLVDALERQFTGFAERLDRLERESRQAERDAAMERGIGMEARIKQQAAIQEQLAALGNEQRIQRYWIAALTTALILCAAAVLWLLTDRYLIGAVYSLWFDVLPALGRRL